MFQPVIFLFVGECTQIVHPFNLSTGFLNVVDATKT